MDRTEYLETGDGQRNERRKRRTKRQLFIVPNHEPKSKTSIADADKIQFQREILAQMKQSGRIAYRSPVVLEIDFFSHQKDPPAVHTLAKNYMDLLQEPVDDSGIERSRLLLADDRQIDVLIVNYHLRQLEDPEIRLQVDTVTNFAQDIALLERIRHHDFRDDPSYDVDSVWDEDSEGRRHDRLSDAMRELREWECHRADLEAQLGPAGFEGMHRMNLMRAQGLHLDTFEPKVQDLLFLLGPLVSGGSGMEKLQAQMRDMIVTPPLMLDLTHAPVKGVGKDVFKTNVANALAAFKAEHSLLFPLLHTAGVTILCVPPKIQAVEGKEQYVDLDNLARYVIPAVHEVLEPPADTVHTLDVAAIADERLRKRCEDRLERMKRTPKYSVTQYQIIRLPRLEGDPDNGLVRLALCNGGPYESLWSRMDQIIGRWE